MKKYDKNEDGVLNRAEAEPMFKEAFEQLKVANKISGDFEWSAAIFADGWKQIDVNKNDTIELKELERFSIHMVKG